MSELTSQRLLSEHSADATWNAINTPLVGRLNGLVNPYVVADYQDLSDEDAIQLGTLIVYKPKIDELRPVVGMAADMLPKDVALRVEEHDPDSRLRVDVLESDKHAGKVSQRVEDVGNGTGLLIIEGEISLGGFIKMFEDDITSYAERGIRAHSRRILDNLPVIAA